MPAGLRKASPVSCDCCAGYCRYWHNTPWPVFSGLWTSIGYEYIAPWLNNSGTQLLALGIIGEYLARMHFRAMERLPYAVRKRAEQKVSHERFSNHF